MTLKLIFKVIRKERKWMMKFASRSGILEPWEKFQANMEYQIKEITGYDVLVDACPEILLLLFSVISLWFTYRVYLRFLARYKGRFYLLVNRRHLLRLAQKHLTPSGIQDVLFSLLEG